MKRFWQILAAVVLLGTESAASMPIGLRMVFWNNHFERASDIVVDVGGGKAVTVPRVWIAGYPAFVAAAGGDAEETVRNRVAANGRKVWECYVLGLNPEVYSVSNDFRITSFPMKADGTPDLEHMSFDPPQTRWNVQGAQPVIKGAAVLDGEWQTVTEQNKASFRFFKVAVELP